jgi:DNA helicase-2/ATP-dependent DNA helicase PcrA
MPKAAKPTQVLLTPDALDQSQQRFCDIEDGAVRLLAPAGSGKTLSLLWRCKALAERSDKIKPRFLLFTFTKAARDELRDRLKTNQFFQELAPLVTVTTLNSWGFRLVKNSTTNPKLIVSKKDRYFCIQNVLQPVWQRYPAIKVLLEDKRRQNKASTELMNLIDFLKSMGFRHDTMTDQKALNNHLAYLISCGMEIQLEGLYKRLVDVELMVEGGNEPQQLFQNFIPFWRECCETLHSSALLSLDDQKYWAWLEMEGQLAEKRYSTGAARFHHILVDEFQDINPLDLALLKAVAAINKAKLTLVGDDDQAIYEWRGAAPDFILEPGKHLGGTYETCILMTNYRSPKNIVALSQKLIAHNKRRVPKDVKANSTTDAHVEVRRFPSIADAITSTVDLVHELLKNPEITNVALIGRKRSQIIPYQIVFAGENIPFYAAEDLQVLLSDAFDELKNMLVIRAKADLPGMFGSDPVQDLLKLCDKVKRYQLSKGDREALSRYLYKVKPATLKDAAKSLMQYDGPLKGTNVGSRMSVSFAAAILPLATAKSVADAIQAISENFEGLQKDYGKSLDDIFYADPPFLYLAEYARRYGNDYQAFYADIEKAIATLARVSVLDDDASEEAEWKLPLHLMTALRAKGKEFDAVIVLDVNDGVWPSKLAKNDNQREQERRVFYVAMTRARRALYFIVNDTILGEPTHASPYLAEMEIDVPQVKSVVCEILD